MCFARYQQGIDVLFHSFLSIIIEPLYHIFVEKASIFFLIPYILDYTNSRSRVSKEHRSAKTPAKSKVRPKISNLSAIKKAVKGADVVYIGYPIWWGEAPHIVYSLVEGVSLKGKTVVPFSTSISSGLGSSGKHLKSKAKISKKTNWLKGRNFYDVPSQKTVNKWVGTLKY